ncbi:hypothetical protein [Chitinibacter sp. ZOR0017]|uniref:hypothetical protein n=1 Tax=Chitinibacter sp. ZOR0017 TaxID=1339254 RepID=UPI000648F9A5|nr:hypothetical protein [Chitinibacter sp. ZOR0017]
MIPTGLDTWRQYRAETERALMTVYRPELEKRREARHGIEDLEYTRRSREVWEIAEQLDRSIPRA